LNGEVVKWVGHGDPEIPDTSEVRRWTSIALIVCLHKLQDLVNVGEVEAVVLDGEEPVVDSVREQEEMRWQW